MTVPPPSNRLRPDSVLRRVGSPDIEHVDIDGETVVYDCRNSALHLLDPIASTIWRALDGTASLHRLSEEFARVFAHPLPETLSDVQSFATDLCRLSLAEVKTTFDE